MSAEGDRAAVLRFAVSPAWGDRAEAGSRLAASAGDPEVDAVLARLLLDANDTGVTLRTAEALIARRDAAGLRVFVRAWDGADFDTGNWLAEGAYSLRASEQDEAELVERLRMLADEDADESVRSGAADLLAWLAHG